MHGSFAFSTRVVVALCVAVALSGCLADEPDTSGEDDDVSADATGVVPVELHLGACRVHDARFLVPAPLVEGDLPPNFTAVGPADGGGAVWMGIMAIECQNASADGIMVTGFSEVRPYAVVEPPEALRDAALDEYLLQFWNLVIDDEVRGLYDSWGHWAWHTDVTFSAEELAVGQVGSAAAAEPLWGRWELHTVVDASAPSCNAEWSTGVFGWSQEMLVGRVDTTIGPACSATGVAKGLLPEMFMGEPVDAVLGGVVNGALTGTGTHYWGDDLDVTQRLVRFPG